MKRTVFNSSQERENGRRVWLKDYWLKNKEKFRLKRREKYFDKHGYYSDSIVRKPSRKRDRMRVYIRMKYKTDITFKLSTLIRQRVGHFLKIRKINKNNSSIEALGCSLEFLKGYLEAQFQVGMSWENYGINGWHLDHIIPLSFFDLTDRKQFLQANHYTNLQPLWAHDNLVKSNKLITK